MQDLGLLRAVKGEDGRTILNSEPRAPVGLSLRVIAMALIDSSPPKVRGNCRSWLKEQDRKGAQRRGPW